MSKLYGTLLAALAVVGMPLFAVLGGISILSWFSSDDPKHHYLRHVAANVLDDKFANSKIIVTIPLFVFVGYLMAESKTPKRIVRCATAWLGWLPGGLAIVCVLASTVFTMLTGGSGVTIVAIGGLLYPVLRQENYPRKFALGLVTTAGAVGLLLPPSPLVLIYCYVTGVSVARAYASTFWPGLVLVGLLCAYAMYAGKQYKVPTHKFDLGKAFRELWNVKWEIFIPILVIGGLGTALMDLHESAAAAALATLLVEVYIYKDLNRKQVLKVAKDAMSLAGAIIIILAMATALTNYVVHAQIPNAILAWFLAKGMSKLWHFIVVLNIFLFIMGMLMDAFSVLLVALPLLVPLAATFGMNPFYLAAMFLLNLEIAYVTPPVGLNLYIASFRFKRPVVEIYRVVIPFLGVLALGLLIIIFFPRLSSFTTEAEIQKLRAEAAKTNVAPRSAWALECVQIDRNNPIPCSDEDIEKYGKDGRKLERAAAAAADAAGDDDDDDDDDGGFGDDDDDGGFGDDDDDDGFGDDDDDDGAGGSKPEGAGGAKPDGAGGSKAAGSGGAKPEGSGGAKPDGSAKPEGSAKPAGSAKPEADDDEDDEDGDDDMEF